MERALPLQLKGDIQNNLPKKQRLNQPTTIPNISGTRCTMRSLSTQEGRADKSARAPAQNDGCKS